MNAVPTTGDRTPAPARARSRAWLALPATVLWGGLLSAGYNLVNHFVRHATRRQFPPEMREAIYGVMPWSLAAFAVAAVVVAVNRSRRLAWIAAAVAAQAVVCAPFGGAAYAAVGLAAAGFALVVLLLLGGRAALGRWRRAVAAAGTRTVERRRASALALAAVFCVCAVVAALLVRQLWRQWHNSLHDNGRWVATKMHVDKALIGAVSFFVTRKPLAGGELNLGAWHGFQEVVHREPVRPARVACTLTIPDGAYGIVRWDAGDGEVGGVRLSRNPEFGSQWFRAGAGGQFLAREPLDLARALDGQRHRVELTWERRELALDGVIVARLPELPSSPVRIGFRCGAVGVFVDDVAIERRDGGATIHEDWSSPYPGWSAFALGLLAFLGSGALLGATARRRPFWFVPAAIAVPATVFLAVLVAVDALVLARANPLWIDYRGHETRIETEAEVVARLRAEAQQQANAGAGTRRLVALGSSQTWGAGAARAEDTWVAQLERLLNDASDRRWRCINGGISGAIATQVFAAYRREWAEPPADLVLVSLSHNDQDGEAFRRALQELVAFHAGRGVHTVFLLEPDSIEGMSHHLPANHAIMREVGAATGTPVVDMMALLTAEHDAGFLWWDGVHLTSFGQRRFAELLHAELRRRELLPP